MRVRCFLLLRSNKILLLFFVFSFIFKTDLSFNQDLGRHIKLGEIILQSREVPKTNLFSYTNTEFPFINTHWFFEVLAYFFSQINGLQLFLILKIFIFLFSVWLILKTIPSKNSVLLLPAAFIFFHVLRERLDLRPEIFSFLFTAVTLFCLEKFSNSPNPRERKIIGQMAALPLIQLLWINMHIYFFVGLILQAIYLFHLVIQYLRFHLEGVKLKFLSFIFILSILISLINPNGIKGFLYPLNVNQNYGYTIVENQTIFLLERIGFHDPNFLWVKISAFLIGLSILIALLRKQSNIKNLLLSVFGLALAVMNIRSFPYLVFLSLPATLTNFGEVKKNSFTNLLSISAGFLLILQSFFYLNGSYYKFRDDPHQVGLSFEENAKGAMDYVIKNNLPQPVYNNFDIGSYIIFKGYPKYKVFVDGRPEAYPKQFFSEVYIPSQSDVNKFKELEVRYNFQTIIFSHTDQTPWGKTFLQNIIKDKDWSIVYFDDFMIVLVKKDLAEEKKLNILSLEKLLPNQYNFKNHLSFLRLGIFLSNNGYPANGELFIQKALQVSPQSPIANSILGNPVTNKFFW